MPKINKQTLQRMQTETLHREFNIEKRAIDEDARTVDLSFSSELAVERWFGDEILDHSTGAMRMNRLNDGAALLMDHNSRDQVGVIQSARIDGDKVGRASVLFSRSARAQEIFQDIVDGIRTKVSVGYRIHEAVLEKTGDEGDTYRVTDWEPFEVSMVSIPADASVGVGRSAEQLVIDTAQALAGTQSEKTESATAVNKAGAMPESKRKQEVVMPKANNNAAPVDLDAVRTQSGADAVKLERQRTKEISAIADRAAKQLPEVASLARAAIESDQSVDAFREILLEKLNDKAAQQRSPLGLTDTESGSFRFSRLLHAAATNDWSEAGFEREVCAATAQRMGGKHKGLMIPTDVLSRAVTTAVAAPTIQTDVLASSFIDLLRAKMKVRELGATVLGGLQGNISIPRQTGAGAAFWVAEGGQPNNTDQAFDNVTLSPKGVAATTQTTLQNLIQSSLDMEAFIRRDIATVLALGIDLAAISGTGAGNQPVGILNTTGIGSVAMGVNGAALANVDPFVDLETLVADSNADGDSMAYLTNARVIGAMKKLKTSTGEYLFSDPIRDLPTAIGSVNGYNVSRSNQISKTLTKGASANVCSAAIFGNWSDLLIGEWGALNLQVDPYSAGIGNIKISALQFVDCGVRHPESFAAITDILAG